MVTSIRASIFALGLLLAPLAAGAQQVVVTNLPPPAPVAETPTASPGPGFAWVGGYWSWNGSQYAWTGGHWERPPQAAQTWESPRWEREGGQYRFRRGRWSGQGVAQPAMPAMPAMPPVAVPTIPPGYLQVPAAPPRPRFERRPRMAPPGQAWVPGHWAWNNSQYVWNAGHFEAPPRPRAVWVAPRVERRGRDWRISPGRWR